MYMLHSSEIEGLPSSNFLLVYPLLMDDSKLSRMLLLSVLIGAGKVSSELIESQILQTWVKLTDSKSFVVLLWLLKTPKSKP